MRTLKVIRTFSSVAGTSIANNDLPTSKCALDLMCLVKSKGFTRKYELTSTGLINQIYYTIIKINYNYKNHTILLTILLTIPQF